MANKSVNLEGDIDNVVIPKKRTFKDRLMALSLSNVPAREWLQKRREGIRPWMEFVNTTKFRVPRNLTPLPKQMMKNVEYFQSNYLFVFLGLVLFCILTSPMLLVAIAASLGACYIISLRNQEQKLIVLGKELALAHQYLVVAVLSFPLFYLAGAGSVVFWVIGASFFVIMLHALFYKPAVEEEGFEIQMEEV